MTTSSSDLPQSKHTTLGLYVTSEEAYEKWQADPDNVILLDVRTPEEYLFVGHPPMAWKVPILFQTYDWDVGEEKYPVRVLSDFVARVSEIANPDSTIMAMCRSGSRSAIAVNMLAKAGYKNVYNVFDGMEGDAHNDSDSAVANVNPQSGWKNSGCPWTKKLTPGRMLLPPAN
ncbi:MAG: rhodanese-like domain-containing protein [Halioglobus sp.]